MEISKNIYECAVQPSYKKQPKNMLTMLVTKVKRGEEPPRQSDNTRWLATPARSRKGI